MAAGAGVTQRSAPRFGLLLFLLALLAIVVREMVVLNEIIDEPVRGDIREYVAAAWNLVQHGVFSTALPPAAPVPDSYRLPGYPWLIALGFELFPQDPSVLRIGGWYFFVLHAQALLGASSVVLVALIARHWLTPTWAIFAGLLLALWPHHVAATNTLLSEVLFGFMLLAGLYAFSRGWATGRAWWQAVAGLAFGYAWLVNPITLFFPPCLAALVWWHGRRWSSVMLVGVFLVPVLCLAWRDSHLDTTSRGSVSRAALNFVQGSWPNYHPAANRYREGDPVAVAIVEEISAENDALLADPAAGLHRIGARLARDPTWYAKWYALKPWILWGWRIRLGAGDIDYHYVRNSPFERNAVLREIKATYAFLNPLLSTLTLAAAIVLTFAGLRHNRSMPATAVGALTLYVTFVHLVLQAEPRYATAYRGLEAALVATALAWSARHIAQFRNIRPAADQQPA